MGGVNVILYEPDRIMTRELQFYREVFMATPFRQIIDRPWVVTVIVQRLNVNISCNIERKQL